eukprot:scaffold537_cov223-Chaetoceros_neogracile.AAC.4
MSTENDEIDTFSNDSEDEHITGEETIQYFPITSPNTPFPSLVDALAHDQSIHGFNLIDHIPSTSNNDFYEETIVIINKCRTFVQKSQGSDLDIDTLKTFLASKEVNEEDYFRPVLDDDAFLMYIDDLEDIKDSQQSSPVAPADSSPSETISQLQMKILALEQQLTKASSYVSNILNEKQDLTPSSVQTGPDNDTYYFSSYSHSSIHETMLRDSVRTEAYQNAILNNSQLFKDKIVMDIGCGTGILSLFAAKAGAKKVIAIDASDMYKEAREIVLLNGYQDVISVVHGKVEDLIENKGGEKLPLEEGEQVDVVISEWMGYGLFFETMLPSVMVVRDALMNKESGTMWPSRSILFLEGAKDSKIEYWSNVYGFNMNVMKDRVVKELRKDAEVEIVNAKDIVTNRDQVIVHDLNTCKDEELDFGVPFELKPNSDLDSCQIDKLVISFDIEFNTRGSAPTSFSTGCQTKPTHWKQTTLWFNPYDGVPVLASNEILKGTFHMERNDVNPRDMDFLVRWDVGSYPEIGSVFANRMSGTIMSKLSSN